ncbi:MAG: lipopolysaccharide biosynthesis protein [Salibacteraceae bacterium]
MKPKINKLLRSGHARNSLWSVVEVVVYPASLLLATPFFLDQLGESEYGIWILANSIIASIGVLNIGLGDATIKFVSKYRAQNQPAKIKLVVQTNYTIYLGLALLVISAGFLVAWLVPLLPWLSEKEGLTTWVSLLIPIGATTLGFRFLEQIFLSIFRGYERFDRAARFAIFSKMAVLMAQVAVVSFGGGLLRIFAATAIVSFVALLAEAFMIGRIFSFSWLKPGFHRDTFREVFGFGVWSWVQSVFVLIAAQIDKPLVAYLGGTVTLAYYALGYMVYTQLHTVLAAGSSWLFPYISGQLEKNADIRSLYQRARGTLISVSLGVLLVLFLLSDWVFTLWLGEPRYAKAAPFLLGFIAYEALIAQTIVPYFFLNGAGKARLNAYFEIAIKSLNIISMVLCSYFWGVLGLIYGLMASMLLFLPIQTIVVAKTLFGRPPDWRAFGALLPSAILITVILVEGSALKYLSLLPLAILVKWIYFQPQRKSTELENPKG